MKVAFLLASATAVFGAPVITNNAWKIEFSDDLEIASASDAAGNALFTDGSSLWTLELVNADGLFELKSTGASSTTLSATDTQLSAQWTSDDAPVVVSMNFTTTAEDAPVRISMSVQQTDGASDVGLWSATLAFGSVASIDSGSLFYPGGYGILHQNPGADMKVSNAYPSGSASMQWMSFSDADSGAGVYCGCHDPKGTLKTITFEDSAFQFKLFPDSMGDSLSSYSPDFEVVLAPVQGTPGSDDAYWDAAQYYRDWALPNAAWTQRGAIADREDIPGWWHNTSIWFNTGWQFVDIFNQTEGDPDLVLERMSNIMEHFNAGGNTVPAALHWYEFQSTYPFDTGYPDYFPPKDGFKDAVKELQDEHNVYVLPYINGRIYDVNISMWGDDHAADSAIWNHDEVLGGDQLTMPTESYGSGATFAVMCPSTGYWQKIIADTVSTLVEEYGCDGVYIDQIGAAAGKPCWTEGHDHGHGGGSFWTDGYREMLDLAAHKGKPLVTESNAESFMDGVSGYLTLQAFGMDYAGAIKQAPAFPAIYGGYFIGFGATFQVTDMTEDGGAAFRAKLTQQWLTGAQLGWMSLAGTQDDPPMGLYDLLMDPSQQENIYWMHMLAEYRSHIADFVVDGRLMRPLDVPCTKNGHDAALMSTTSPIPPESERIFESREDGVDMLDFDPHAGAVWMNKAEDSLLLLLATSVKEAVCTTHYNVSLADYGLGNAAKVAVYQMIEDGEIGLFYETDKGYVSGEVWASDTWAEVYIIKVVEWK